MVSLLHLTDRKMPCCAVICLVSGISSACRPSGSKSWKKTKQMCSRGSYIHGASILKSWSRTMTTLENLTAGMMHDVS